MAPSVEPDRAQVEALWHRAIAIGVIDASTPLPSVVEPFGDGAELAVELIALVVDGPKRATAGALADYEREAADLPASGALSIATDGRGRPRAVLQTTEVRIDPLSSVDDSFARDEGEGDRTRRSWLEDHETLFRRYLPTIGIEFDRDMATVFERSTFSKPNDRSRAPSRRNQG